MFWLGDIYFKPNVCTLIDPCGDQMQPHNLEFKLAKQSHYTPPCVAEWKERNFIAKPTLKIRAAQNEIFTRILSFV